MAITDAQQQCIWQRELTRIDVIVLKGYFLEVGVSSHPSSHFSFLHDGFPS